MSSAYTPDRVIPTYAVITGIGVALTGLRLWVRTSYIRAPIGSDDITALLAAVFVTAALGMQVANALIGTAGNSVMSADTERRARISLKINWINPILSPWAFGFIKLSLSLFYRRIFGVWSSFRWMNNIVMCVVVAYTVGFSLAQLSLCGTNFHLIWIELSQQPARDHCAERGTLQFCYALMSVVTDVLVVGLPLVFVHKLQMSTRKKLASTVVFALGFASTGASLGRFIYNAEAFKYGWFKFAFKPAPGMPAIPSPVFKTLNPTFLAMIEMGFGLWGANLPALSPLLHSFHPLRLVNRLYSKASSAWTGSTSTTETSKGSLGTVETRKGSLGTVGTEMESSRSDRTSSDMMPLTLQPIPSLTLSLSRFDSDETKV